MPSNEINLFVLPQTERMLVTECRLCWHGLDDEGNTLVRQLRELYSLLRLAKLRSK